MNRSHAYGMLLCLLIGLSACTPKLETPDLSPGRANFERVVALGGHIMAGYQDGALYREGQEAALPALIARQIALLPQSGNLEFKQAKMPAGDVSLGLNAKPWISFLQTRSQIGNRVDCENESSLGPVKTSMSYAQAQNSGLLNPVGQAGQIHNLSIPFAGISALKDPQLGQNPAQGGASMYYSRFPDHSQSPLAIAQQMAPTFVMMWPGMQDIYDWAAQGATTTPPDPIAFQDNLDSILSSFAATGSKGVLATIPDIGTMPFFTTIPPRGLHLSSNLADSLNNIYNLVNANVNFQAGDNGFIVADQTTPQGFRQLTSDEYITLNVPLDSMRCFLYGVLFQLLGDEYSLISSELAQIRTHIAQLNAVITSLASQYDFALVDAHGFYERLQSGFVFDAVDFNTDFVSGGYFSLDGYTPHPKGAGLLANEFIRAINTHYGATIPPTRIDALRGVLFP